MTLSSSVRSIGIAGTALALMLPTSAIADDVSRPTLPTALLAALVNSAASLPPIDAHFSLQARTYRTFAADGSQVTWTIRPQTDGFRIVRMSTEAEASASYAAGALQGAAVQFEPAIWVTDSRGTACDTAAIDALQFKATGEVDDAKSEFKVLTRCSPSSADFASAPRSYALPDVLRRHLSFSSQPDLLFRGYLFRYSPTAIACYPSGAGCTISDIANARTIEVGAEFTPAIPVTGVASPYIPIRASLRDDTAVTLGHGDTLVLGKGGTFEFRSVTANARTGDISADLQNAAIPIIRGSLGAGSTRIQFDASSDATLSRLRFASRPDGDPITSLGIVRIGSVAAGSHITLIDDGSAPSFVEQGPGTRYAGTGVLDYSYTASGARAISLQGLRLQLTAGAASLGFAPGSVVKTINTSGMVAINEGRYLDNGRGSAQANLSNLAGTIASGTLSSINGMALSLVSGALACGAVSVNVSGLLRLDGSCSGDLTFGSGAFPVDMTHLVKLRGGSAHLLGLKPARSAATTDSSLTNLHANLNAGRITIAPNTDARYSGGNLNIPAVAFSNSSATAPYTAALDLNVTSGIVTDANVPESDAPGLHRSLHIIAAVAAAKTSWQQRPDITYNKAVIPTDTPIQSLAVRIKTNDGVFDGTDTFDGLHDAVWLDLGPTAWLISGDRWGPAGGFKKGSDETVQLDPNDGNRYDRDHHPIAVPLYVGDLTQVRLDKKGLLGFTNAPDSIYDAVIPPTTVQGLVAAYRAQVGRETSALKQVQHLVNLDLIAEKAEQQAINAAVILFDQASADLISANSALSDARGILTSAQATLSGTAREISYQVSSSKWCWAFAGPFLCWETRWASRPNGAWDIANQAYLRAQSEFDSATARVTDLVLRKQQALIDKGSHVAKKLVLEADIKRAQAEALATNAAIDGYSSSLDLLQKGVNKLPPLGVTIPTPGQWSPKEVTLIVNGSTFMTVYPHTRLRRLHSEYVRPLDLGLGDADVFVRNLRVNRNKPGDAAGEEQTGVTTIFGKNSDISGWFDDRPVRWADHIIGTLVNNPSPGCDHFVSLDLDVQQLTIGSRPFTFDTTNGIRHKRFIRVEYFRTMPDGTEDSRFIDEGWKPGDRFDVSGRIRWDTDKYSFYEVHPVGKSRLQRIFNAAGSPPDVHYCGR